MCRGKSAWSACGGSASIVNVRITGAAQTGSAMMCRGSAVWKTLDGCCSQVPLVRISLYDKTSGCAFIAAVLLLMCAALLVANS
jgi:hypothetical protein